MGYGKSMELIISTTWRPKGKTLWAQVKCSVRARQVCILFFKSLLFILDRGEGREKERARNIHVWLPLTHPPPGTWLGLQPKHVPWLRIKPAALWFAGQCSIHWATPGRAQVYPYIWASRHGDPQVTIPDLWNHSHSSGHCFSTVKCLICENGAYLQALDGSQVEKTAGR